MLVKSKIKHYPDGSKKVLVYNEVYLVETGEKKSGGGLADAKTPEEIAEEREQSKKSNMFRVRTKIKDYVLSNDFDMFWSLTFGDERDDDERCFNRLSNWLKYMKKKHGKFDYILIPERHKNGCLHFHGVTGGFGGDFVDSGVKKKGHTIYNCSEWGYGFSTVSEIRNRDKTANYISKYITKDMDENVVEKGKKKYWSSRGLREPVIEYLEHDPLEGHTPTFANDVCKIYTISADGQIIA